MLSGLLLLIGGPTSAQDDPRDDVLEESLGVQIEMLEPDLDYLLETLEAVSCLCSCQDFCAGECAGADSCEDWCLCAPPAPVDVAPADVAPVDVAPAEVALPVALPSALVPFEPDSVFSRVGEVRVPTCLCIWQFEGGGACNVDVTWPVGAREDCDCGRFLRSPGCGGATSVISVMLAPGEKK